MGTHPEGSAWRPVGKYVKSSTTLRKDAVRVPGHLQPGDYVLGWRWDGEDISQVGTRVVPQIDPLVPQPVWLA